jgi:glycosyltransferase involved in cell wall biosynthesis
MRHCARSIFSFDDAIYAGHDDCSKLNHPRLYRYKYSGDLGSVIAGATHVIAGNSTLAGYARQFSEAVTVIPTVVDLQHYPFSPPNECSPLTIGWFGSNSTSPYLEQVLPALREIEFRFGKKVRFRFFGDPTFKPDLKRSESLPFRLSSEIEDLRSLDIGIMPMPDTPWTRGKCSFKAIQYMALGIPAVVSPIGSAADIIEHEKTGLWAITEAEWISSLSRLIQDKAYRREIAFRARLRVEENYSVQRWAPVFVEVINNVLKHPATAKNSLQVASPA